MSKNKLKSLNEIRNYFIVVLPATLYYLTLLIGRKSRLPLKYIIIFKFHFSNFQKNVPALIPIALILIYFKLSPVSDASGWGTNILFSVPDTYYLVYIMPCFAIQILTDVQIEKIGRLDARKVFKWSVLVSILSRF